MIFGTNLRIIPSTHPVNLSTLDSIGGTMRATIRKKVIAMMITAMTVGRIWKIKEMLSVFRKISISLLRSVEE
jgi:hypothetical protein